MINKNLIIVTMILSFIPLFIYGHWWRTNSSWCHNCRTWACAWTYHCHNWWSSNTNNSSNNIRRLTCDLWQCNFNGKCRNKPANSSCTIWSTIDAWACNAGYYESNNSCIRTIEKTYNKANEWSSYSTKPTTYQSATQSQSSNEWSTRWIRVLIFFWWRYVYNQIKKDK